MRVFLSGLSLPTTYAQSISKHRVTILTDIEADPDGDNLSFLWFAYPEAAPIAGNTNWDHPKMHSGFMEPHLR